MYNTYTGLLKMYNTFKESGETITIIYTDIKNKQELFDKYKIDNVAGNGDDFNRAVNLLEWVSNNIYHNGYYDNHIKENAAALLDYAFNNGEDCGINCKALSVILSQCLNSLGIKSRIVYLFPCSPYDTDNHVVCEVFIASMNKWIMLDPTFCLYFKDTADNPLGIYEIRTLLSEQCDLYYFDNAHYNNNGFDIKETIAYYAKNLFFIQIPEHQGEFIGSNRAISIVPFGYDLSKRVVQNAKYCVKILSNVQWALDILEERIREDIVYKDIDFLK
jgi:hypothetical protein